MERTITVRGVGRAVVKPDLINIDITLKAKNKKYEEAMEFSNGQLEKLQNALEGAGFNKDSLKSTDFNVCAEYENSRTLDGGYRREFCGFVCTHGLKLSFELDMDRLAAALCTVSGCLAEPEINVSFTVGDPTAVSEKLLKNAAEDARKKAEILCEASGCRLGRLVSVDYGCSDHRAVSPTGMVFSANCRTAAKMADITPDNIDLTDFASFIWEID